MRAPNNRRQRWLSSRDSMTASVAGRLHTGEAARSCTDIREAAQRAEKGGDLNADVDACAFLASG